MQENTDFLIEHMRAHVYSVSYVKNCRSTSNYIIRLSSELSWESYDDVRSWCSTNEAFSEQYRENLQFAISVLEQYDESQKLLVHPTNQSQFLLPLHSAGKLDLFPIQERMAEFEKSMQDKGHKPEYIKKLLLWQKIMFRHL